MQIRSLVVVILVSFALNVFAQTPRQMRNLTAFSRLYGYVQYFHPSDEASRVEWQSFAIYGIKKMLAVKNESQLIPTLNELFLPIAPTIKIAEGNKIKLNLRDIRPHNLSGYVPIYWQHIGLKLPYYDNIYSSIRVNRINPISTEGIRKEAFAVIAPVDVRAYSGKKFILSISVNSDIKDLLLIPYKEKLKLLGKPVRTGVEKRYDFEDRLDQNATAFAFAVQSNLAGSIDIKKISMRILDTAGAISLPLQEKATGLNELDAKIDTRIIRLFKGMGNGKIFNREISIGESISANLVPGIRCMIPLALYGNQHNTYPIADGKKVEELLKQAYDSWLKDKNGDFRIEGDDLTIRLADLVILFNVLKHAYPYWEDASHTHDQLWTEALHRAFSDKTPHDFLKTLKWIANKMNDGHMFIDLWDDSDKDFAVLPVLFDQAEGKILIKKVLEPRPANATKVGDELISIDGKNPFVRLDSIESLYSGSKQWKRLKAMVSVSKGREGNISHLTIKRDSQVLSIDWARTLPFKEYIPGSDRNNRPAFEWLSGNIFYINLNKTTTKAHMADMLRAKSIIMDMRGYLNEDTETFLSHLTNKKIHAESGMLIPQILYPDYQKISYIIGSYNIVPALPYVKARIFLLADATGQSATESFLAAYKQFGLATIIGQPTSGTNGNINLISMPGGYRFFFSGMLVKNPDGSKHHLKGVIPDVNVRNTIYGIRNGRDEILDEAVRRAKEN